MRERGKDEGKRPGERQGTRGKVERRGNIGGPLTKQKKTHPQLGADSTRKTPTNRASKGTIGAQEVLLGPLFERRNTRRQL